LKKYELVFILDEAKNADGGDAFIKEAEPYIVSLGGAVIETHNMGRRLFSYPIAKQRAGYYWDLILELAPAQVKALKEHYRLNVAVLRMEIFLSKSKESVGA